MVLLDCAFFRSISVPYLGGNTYASVQKFNDQKFVEYQYFKD